jgi:hypothetical protein
MDVAVVVELGHTSPLCTPGMAGVVLGQAAGTEQSLEAGAVVGKGTLAQAAQTRLAA